MNANIKARITNPIFWTTLIGLFLGTTRINPETLTSWNSLKDALLSVVGNPYLVGCFIVAMFGQWNNPVVKGLGDEIKVVEEKLKQ